MLAAPKGRGERVASLSASDVSLVEDPSAERVGRLARLSLAGPSRLPLGHRVRKYHRLVHMHIAVAVGLGLGGLRLRRVRRSVR